MKSSLPRSRDARRRLRIAIPALFLLATVACASTPIPESNMQSAAQQAITAKNMVAAERLADQSRAAAELASARTSAVKAIAVNANIEKSNATLIEEMQRGTGVTK